MSELDYLIFQFFKAFSRFEFALKVNGHFQYPTGNRSDPGWSSFYQKYEEDYQLCTWEMELLENLPKLQKKDCEGNLTWKNLSFKSDATELSQLILAIKTMRNNLFHGGKCGDPDWDTPERIKFLLQRGLKTLSHLKDLDDDIREKFDGLVFFDTPIIEE